MAPRLIYGVTPRYAAVEELAPDAASAALVEAIGAYLDEAEHYLRAREAYRGRCSLALTKWKNKERIRLNLSTTEKPKRPPGLLASIKARCRLEIEVEYEIADLDAAPRLQIKAPAGLGKTTALIKAIASRPFWRYKHVDFYVPTIELADEQAENVREAGGNARVIRGRQKSNCRKHKAAKLAAARGLNVSQSLCHQAGDNEQRCEHFKTCPYMAQFSDFKPGFRIHAHSYLPLHRPQPTKRRLPRPDLVIIDESFALSMVKQASLGVDNLEGPALEAARESLDTGKDFRLALIEHGVTREFAEKQASSLDQPLQTNLRPNMAEKEALRLLRASPGEIDPRLARFWRAIASEIDFERPFHGIEICQERSRLCRWRTAKTEPRPPPLDRATVDQLENPAAASPMLMPT